MILKRYHFCRKFDPMLKFLHYRSITFAAQKHCYNANSSQHYALFSAPSGHFHLKVQSLHHSALPYVKYRYHNLTTNFSGNFLGSWSRQCRYYSSENQQEGDEKKVKTNVAVVRLVSPLEWLKNKWAVLQIQYGIDPTFNLNEFAFGAKQVHPIY